MLSKIREIFDESKADLLVYSPYNFLRDIDPLVLTRETFVKPLMADLESGECKAEQITVSGYDHFLIYKNLKWDTDYFGFSVNRIDCILYRHEDQRLLSEAIHLFSRKKMEHGEYFFMNVPCEDTTLTQAFSGTEFRLVETRMNYILSGIGNHNEPRQKVRMATIEDIPALRDVAYRMRNRHDRVHADPAFTSIVADEYLGTFISEAVKGFADMVMVPDNGPGAPFGFLAANRPVNIMGKMIAKLVLAAVDDKGGKGWLYRLLSEVINEEKKYATEYLTTITQASNRAAVRTWEKAGFRYGFTTHIFSYRRP